MSEMTSGESTERPRTLVSSLGLHRRLNLSQELTRARLGIPRARSHLPMEIALGHCYQIQLTAGSGLIAPSRRPGRCPHRGDDHDSSFANNRTLADIPLYARHLLFILSSCSLHVSGPTGSCRWPTCVASACAADGQMFDAVDPAGARRPWSPRLVICQPM